MLSPIKKFSAVRQLDLLRALVSYSFAILISKRRIEMNTRGAKAKDKSAVSFRANEITGSINAALISDSLKANASFPLLVATQLHALCDAMNAALSDHGRRVVAVLLAGEQDAGLANVLRKGTYAEMKRPVRELVSELMTRPRVSGLMAYSVFVEFASSLWPEEQQRDSLHSEILREIRFAPEHQQAGVSILAYFSVVLRQKLPGMVASVSIRQDPGKVTLIISYPDGREEEIVQTLSDYGLVVQGELQPEQFLADPLQVLALKQKLELAGVELRMARELRAVERASYETRLDTLESEVKYLRDQLSAQLQLGSGVSQQFLEILRDVAQAQSGKGIDPLLGKLVDAVISRDEMALKSHVSEIECENPTVLDRLSDFIWSSSLGGVIGNATYDWLKVFWPILPK